MSAGRYTVRLRRGIKERREAQLYVRRRTTKRGQDRVIVPLPASVRYALCVWASYRLTRRERAVSQELLRVVWEGLQARLGQDAELVLESVYGEYAKRCEEAGNASIFEVPQDA
jgi:hypothetical protein